MFKVRAKTTDGKLLSGPSATDSYSEAATEAEEAARAAGKTLKSLTIVGIAGESKITLGEPRKRASKTASESTTTHGKGKKK